MAREERNSGKSVKEQTKAEAKPAAKTSTATPRTEPRKDRTTQDNRARRTSREPAWLTRFRNSRIGRFVFESYYELRHKVTWPTFEEARNMTLIVIVLSGVIGAALALVDFGLYHLFILISGGK
jgi:preprotein translocase subunit SecE